MIPAKICGITRLADALAAAELGAAAVGFVFYARSPRCLEVAQAARISAKLPPQIARVGVFVNPDLQTLILTAKNAGLTHIQLHGEEEVALCQESPLPVIKAVRSPVEFDAYKNVSMAAFLIDSKTQDQFGGTGQLSDWNFSRQVKAHAPVILAGGLSSSNIAQALATAQPDAVDLSSSVELAPGIKDHHKLREFFATLRQIEIAERQSSKIF